MYGIGGHGYICWYYQEATQHSMTFGFYLFSDTFFLSSRAQKDSTQLKEYLLCSYVLQSGQTIDILKRLRFIGHLIIYSTQFERVKDSLFSYK